MTRRIVVDDLRLNPETGLYRREDGVEFALDHDAGRDMWVSPDAAEYVQTLNRIADPVYVRIGGEVWRTRANGTIYSIDWNTFPRGGGDGAGMAAPSGNVVRLKRDDIP